MRWNEIYSAANHLQRRHGRRGQLLDDGLSQPRQRHLRQQDLDAWDDGIEAEGGNTNVRIWGNYLDRTATGIATTVTAKGPVYIFRNVWSRNQFYQDLSTDADERQPLFKSGSDASLGDGRRYLFHNTMLQATQAGSTYPLGGGAGVGGTGSTQLVNNTSPRTISTTCTNRLAVLPDRLDSSFERDMYNGTASVAVVNGISAAPTYAAGSGWQSESGGMYQLAAGTPGYDQGVRIDNFNDSYVGAAPDVGAAEAGMPAMKFGIAASTGAASSSAPGTLTNISTRGSVQGSSAPMIAGFVISGSSPKTVVVTAKGPSLIPYGIANALANPMLTLVRSSDNAVLATNDDWGNAANALQIQSSGFAPSNPLESAILATLAPGVYTAVVSGSAEAAALDSWRSTKSIAPTSRSSTSRRAGRSPRPGRDDRRLRHQRHGAAHGRDHGEGAVAFRVRHCQPTGEPHAHAGAIFRPGGARDQRRLGQRGECRADPGERFRAYERARVGHPPHPESRRIHGDRERCERRYGSRDRRGVRGAVVKSCWIALGGVELYARTRNSQENEMHGPLAALACLALGLSWAGVADAAPLSNITAISAGNNHTCALTSAGGVKCWGNNLVGQLGDGTTTNRTTAVDVVGLTSGVIAIAGGSLHTCALTAAGQAKCWGDNYFGALGDGTTQDRLTPVDVLGLSSGVSRIASGGDNTCVMTASGGMKCWGRNAAGEVGDGTWGTVRSAPVDVSGLGSGVASVASAGNNSCAIMTSGGLKCWGLNGSGEVGDGTTIPRYVPVDVSGLSSGVSSTAVGVGFVCAVVGGGIKCWGYDADGQLGDGGGPDKWTPVDVPGLTSGMVNVAAGIYGACALTNGGGVKCWGHNQYGEGRRWHHDAAHHARGCCRTHHRRDRHRHGTNSHVRAVERRHGEMLGIGDSGQLGNGSTDQIQPLPVTVGSLVPQSITFDPLAARDLNTSPVTLTASASSGLAVSFNSTTPSICTVAGSSVTLLTIGVCTPRRQPARRLGLRCGRAGDAKLPRDRLPAVLARTVREYLHTPPGTHGYDVAIAGSSWRAATRRRWSFAPEGLRCNRRTLPTRSRTRRCRSTTTATH
jgi:alpha-tubulin suppressor-like RCC1 family protein